MFSCSRLLRPLIFVVLALGFSACGGGGGGGGGGSTPPNVPPVAPPAQGETVVAPAVTLQPQAAAADDGQPATFTIAASGTAPLTYQWYRDGQIVPGATSASYAIGAVGLQDDGAQYTVVVGNSGGAVTSQSAVLTVVPVAPTLTTQPQAQMVLEGATATFTSVAAGSAPLHFQWRKNSVAISGANNASYVTPATAGGDSGALFDVVVSNAAGSIASATALLTVGTVPVAPSIVAAPQSAAEPVGGAIAFAVVASGTAPLSYQWLRNGVDIANATTSTLIVAPVSGLNDHDSYTVRVSNVAGSVVSGAAQLTVATQAGQIDLLAGTHAGEGNNDGTGGNAHMRTPTDVAFDAAGNMFIADTGNATVRKVTPGGVVTTLAGLAGTFAYVDGTATTARFKGVRAVAASSSGDVFVVDGTAIRKITPAGVVTTFAGAENASGYADGTGGNARFSTLIYTQIAVASDDSLYVADCDNEVIRKITPAGVVSTFAGIPNQSGSADGPTSSATFSCPSGVAVDSADNLYVADADNHIVRKISAGVVSTLAGTATPFGNDHDGIGAAASFRDPRALTVDSGGNVFVVDFRLIRKITPAGVVTTFAGKTSFGGDGVGTAAYLPFPQGIAVDGADNLFVADRSLNAIRKITPAAVVTTFPNAQGDWGYEGYADATGANARFYTPVGVTTDSSGNAYVVDSMNCSVRKIDGNGVVTLVAGNANFNPLMGNNCSGAQPPLDSAKGIAMDAAGNFYVSNQSSYPNIRKVTPAGVVSVLAGPLGNELGHMHGIQDGVGNAARFGDPAGVAFDGNGNLFVADIEFNTIRKIVIATRQVSTLAGNPLVAGGFANGAGTAALFNEPAGIATDTAGNIYVADVVNHCIRKVTQSGVVTTLAGQPGVAGYVDGPANLALFSAPIDVAVDAAGNVYVADTVNWLIRKITPAGVVSTVAGTKGLKGQALGPLPGSMNQPVGIHAHSPGSSGVELLVTIDHGVVRISLP
jgi:hypothetical protein